MRNVRYVKFVKIFIRRDMWINLTVGKKIWDRFLIDTAVGREGSEGPDRSPCTPGIQISCACRKGGQVANRAAREGDRDRHPETFITFGFKGAHCAVNGVPRVPSFLLSRSYVPWIRSILRRLPFRESVKRRGRKEEADVR